MNGTVEGSFTGTDVSEAIGVGPVFYRLSYAAGSGQVDYFFGYDSLFHPRKPLLLLNGTWTGSVSIQYTSTPDDAASWVSVTDETYTANASRRMQ